MMTLKEKCPILHFTDKGDERGKLVVVEGKDYDDEARHFMANSEIPFEIKRVFYIYGSDDTVIRGQHANKESEFVLINVSGESKVRITDGEEELIVTLNKPMMGVYIPKMIWKDMYGFSSDSVLLVLASTHFDNTEYIRDYKEYLRLSNANKIDNNSNLLPMNEGENRILLSLCIPTNGVSEWVFQSLNSIYEQNIDEDLYEVIIMDNGNNTEFRNKINDLRNKHSNLKYYHTEKPLFLSEPEAYKKASGELIKFINHRFIMREGSLQYLLDYVNKYRDTRPVIYFTNGATKHRNERRILNSFSEFVVELEYYSSWSGGMTIWKHDFEDMKDSNDFNYLFPHTNILFHKRNAGMYIVDGKYLWDEANTNGKPKGNYNVFFAFAVEYLCILLELLRENSITNEDFLQLKKENLDFLTGLYYTYIVKKDQCCYDLSDYKKSLRVFYSVNLIRMNIIPYGCKRFIKKVCNCFSAMFQ